MRVTYINLFHLNIVFFFLYRAHGLKTNQSSPWMFFTTVNAFLFYLKLEKSKNTIPCLRPYKTWI